jgi:hypothetical protein
MVFTRNVRCYGVRLSVLEILDQRSGMCVRIERDELDKYVISQDKTDELGSLRFVQTAPFNLDVLVRPSDSKAQEVVEQIPFDCSWNDKGEDEREQ